ncbi:MAG: response regulator [Deltaproteobacteria bacterium]|nr:response regulator [Deltaproteobacteria bacterium]
MRILIVDDELVSREKLRKIMSTFGQCVLAENGKDALRIASSQTPPDLILMDISMPEMDGYEVCKKLKAKQKTSNIPFIFISGKGEEGDESKGFELGAVDYIRKPFSPSIVKARVRTHLELKKYRDRLEELVTERTLELNDATKKMQAEVIERKHAEDALEAEKFKLKEYFENLPILAYKVTTDGKIADCNNVVIKTLGFVGKDDLIGKPFISTLHTLDTQEKAKKLFEIWKKKKKIKNEELRIATNQGEILDVLLNMDTIFDKDGIPIHGLSTHLDVTELKRADEERKSLENQLHRAQKMESLGIMAGGIAHDLNNILSGIVSYPELLLMDIPMDSPLRKPIETIRESGIRAVDVVADLLTITRGVAIGKDVLNLNTLVTEYLGSAEHQILGRTNSFVKFKTELESGLLNTRGSETHIRKTLLNLVFNATESIEESGTVSISTENRYLDEPLRGYEDVRQGEYAVLRISDDGCGISPKDLERIFEPFYTKKVMSRSGTGLGLAVVWNTVQDHNGYINVNSNENGTVFELYFPATRQELFVQETMVSPEDYLGRGETVLVVDDEERQREIATKMLTKLGYNAEAVSSGEEAIVYVNERSVDLIILDMVMPKGINGRETYEEIIKIKPGQKAVIASGYAKTQEVQIAQELGAGEYIKKPYTFEKIGIAVKKELEKLI